MFLTLPSNSSASVFLNNTQSEFRTQLPEAIELEGEWEMGLAEIMYPKSWYNLLHNEQITIGSAFNMEIKQGLHESVEELFKVINENIKDTLGGTDKKEAVQGKDVRFEYLPCKKTMIRNPEKVMIYVTKALGEMLGFQSNLEQHGSSFLFTETLKSDHVADISHGIHHLYVYCDVVEPHVVGDSKVQLLRIVPVEKGEVFTKNYENIQYFPVQTKKFSTIEINIKDDTNTPINFNYGKTVVILHFRPKKV